MLQASLASAPPVQRPSLHEAVLIDPGAEADIPWAAGNWAHCECKYLSPLQKERAYFPVADARTIRAGVERRALALLHKSLHQGPSRTDFRVARVGQDLAGFALVDGTRPILHYLYVVDTFRHAGIGFRLVRDVLREPWSYTHRTPPGWKFAEAVGKKTGFNPGRFDPYLLDFIGDH
jgi:GNAT superfamily N-acetyltransferase